MHFRDESGFGLSPTWNEATRGMESKGLKEIIKRLRGISEEKKIEWTEDVAKADLLYFFKKAHANTFYRKNFMCCFLNKYKDLIIVSEIESPLSKKMLEEWYKLFPDKKDPDRDIKGVEIIIGYFKQQYIKNKISFTDESALSSFKTILLHIQADEFWSKKSLVSIGYNISEFVLRIKQKQNGTANIRGIGEKPNPTTNTPGSFGKL